MNPHLMFLGEKMLTFGYRSGMSPESPHAILTSLAKLNPPQLLDLGQELYLGAISLAMGFALGHRGGWLGTLSVGLLFDVIAHATFENQ
jgi:hypothetical protein